MTTDPRLAAALRWAGRLLGLAAVLTFLAFAIGEGLHPANLTTAEAESMTVLVAGLAAAAWLPGAIRARAARWRWPRGASSRRWNFARIGPRWELPFFVLLALPALVTLLAVVLDRGRRPA